MTTRFASIHRVFQLGLLRIASLLVPGEQRAEWSREWHSELWHVRQACAPMGTVSREGEREVTAFCAGALHDALWLRQQHWQRRSPLVAWQGSAAQCTLVLAAVGIVTYAVALLLPGVRAQRSLTLLQASPGLVLIQEQRQNDTSSPTISPKQFRGWKEQKQLCFDGFAFYRVMQESVSTESHPEAGWGVARASSNLFVLLGLPVRFADAQGKVDGDLPKVILSEELWKKEFGANPLVAGSVVRVGLRKARIAGVAPNGFWGLPGKVDAWLLEPDSEMVSGSLGYVVAHLTASGKSRMWSSRIPITAYKADETEDNLLGVSLDRGTPSQWAVFVFAVFLGFLALPATTSVSLGDYSLSPKRTSWSNRLHRWSFLSAKIALLLPIVYFVSLDLAYGPTTFNSTTAVYIQLVSSFSICLFGLRWVLRDQRRRCPVCLRRVVHPAHVGYASRMFLAWNGTEMICMSGHTLLHVPEMPTSWFSTQRWLYLDTSWGFLFPDGDVEKKELITGFSSN